jgi:PHD/YefM family antitoxin component YafN of YafNO toxin-antitoxin module
LTNIHDIELKELEIILCLLPGGEYSGVTTGDYAITSQNEKVVVIGYSEEWKEMGMFFTNNQSLSEHASKLKKLKITSEYTSQNQSHCFVL